MGLRLDNSGSIIIEFALILPLLFLITFLSFDVALYLLDRQKASRVVATQVFGLVSQATGSEIRTDLEELLATQSFYRVRHQEPVKIFSVCLCDGESLSDLADATNYLCLDPPRCQTNLKRYAVISVDFAVAPETFSFAQGSFLPSFNEAIVIREN